MGLLDEAAGTDGELEQLVELLGRWSSWDGGAVRMVELRGRRWTHRMVGQLADLVGVFGTVGVLGG